MHEAYFLAVAITMATVGAQAQVPSVVVTPATQQIDRDSSGDVRIRVSSIAHVHAYHLQLTFDPVIVRCRHVTFLGFLGTNTFPASTIDSVHGTVTMDEAILGVQGQSGSGDLVELRFWGLANGTSSLTLASVDFRDTVNQLITVTTENGSIRVGPPDGVPENHGGLPRETVLHGYPNPFNSSVTFRYSAGEGGESAIRIYTLLGTLVFALDRSDPRQSLQEFLWAGRDMNNVDVASGVYIVQILESDEVRSAKVLLVR